LFHPVALEHSGATGQVHCPIDDVEGFADHPVASADDAGRPVGMSDTGGR
jgi:hypothetical protein